MTHVFISYSHSDRAFVERLVGDLVKRLPQLNIVYDKLVEPGASWALSLSAQIERAEIVLAVLSPDYLASVWAQHELSVALDRQLKNHARLIPVLLRPCVVTGLLAGLAWIDFTEDYEAALASLVWGITGERPKAAKGEQPGDPTTVLEPSEVDSLRREVHAAVELFKSGIGEAETAQQAGQHPPARIEDKRRCFVVMPFSDKDLQVVYEDFIQPTLTTGCSLHCERGDDVFGSNVIMEDIMRSITAADVIVADLTGKNANVFYEVGICHALGKPVLLLSQSSDDVPFDLRHRRVLLYDYSPRGCKRLEAMLRESMKAMLRDLGSGRVALRR